MREIPPKNAVALIEGIQDLGLCSRGSGADNIRNVTGTPTAGIDPQEILDTREYAREWHYHILNDRSLTGLPRKFNVAFDGAGKIAVLEDTNDIAFSAVEVKDGFGVEPGVWFKLGIGGITGHRDFAADTGIIVKPADATRVSDAIVRVFIDLGDRTNRLKARLKYVIDGMGMEKFLVLVEEKLGHAFTRVPPEALAPRPAFDRTAHIGVHKQKQDGLELDRRGAAAGQGDLRTDARPGENRARSRRRRYPPHGLAEPADFGRARRQGGARDRRDRGDRPCDKNLGTPRRADCLHRPRRLQIRQCRHQAHRRRIADWCDPRVPIETPINIHLTGCHHSCAQHYISDIGMIGARIPVGDTDDTVDGFHVFTGGGFGPDAEVGQEVFHDVTAEDAPVYVERLLKAYVSNRASPDETFLTFARRHDGETLRKLADAEVSS